MLALDGTPSTVTSGASKTKSKTKDTQSREDVKFADATRSAALDVEAAFRAALESEVPQIAEKLRLYLANDDVHDINGVNNTRSPTSTVQTGGSSTETVSVLLGHIQERVVDAYVAFRRAAEFLPAEESGTDTTDSSPAKREERTFASPDDIRTLFKALC